VDGRSDPLQMDPQDTKVESNWRYWLHSRRLKTRQNSLTFVCCHPLQMDPILYKGIRSNRSDPLQIDPILCKSIRSFTNRSDSIQIDPILYKSIRFYTNRSDSTQIDPISICSVRFPFVRTDFHLFGSISIFHTNMNSNNNH
jgi:hypothetical protein